MPLAILAWLQSQTFTPRKGAGWGFGGRAWWAIEGGVELGLELCCCLSLCGQFGVFVELGLHSRWGWDGPFQRERVLPWSLSGVELSVSTCI